MAPYISGMDTPYEAPRLVALCASSMGSGKSEVASILRDHGYHSVKLAAPVKALTRAFFKACGVAGHKLDDMVDGDLKETPCAITPYRAISPRVVMQTLGTEWGRGIIHPDIWADLCAEHIDRILDSGYRVVVDDLRYPNEWRMLKTFGAFVMNLHRPGAQPLNDHPSEGALTAEHFDCTLENDSNLVMLRWRVCAALRLEG